MTSLTDTQLRNIILTPNEAHKKVKEFIEYRRTHQNEGMFTGIGTLDKYIVPLQRSEVAVVMGRTSHLKSTWMQYWAEYTAKRIREEQDATEAVIFMTWEDAAEVIEAKITAHMAGIDATKLLLGTITDEEFKAVEKAGMQRVFTPVYIVGHRLSMARPHISVEGVNQVLEYIKQNHNTKPRMVVIDYFQRVDTKKGRTRREEVSVGFEDFKNLALRWNCGIVVGSQANRQSYGDDWPVPDITSGMETANQEQTADLVAGISFPCRSMDVGKTITKRYMGKYVKLVVRENLAILQIHKRKIGRAGAWFPMRVNPALCEFHAVDIHFDGVKGETSDNPAVLDLEKHGSGGDGLPL